MFSWCPVVRTQSWKIIHLVSKEIFISHFGSRLWVPPSKLFKSRIQIIYLFLVSCVVNCCILRQWQESSVVVPSVISKTYRSRCHIIQSGNVRSTKKVPSSNRSCLKKLWCHEIALQNQRQNGKMRPRSWKKHSWINWISIGLYTEIAWEYVRWQLDFHPKHGTSGITVRILVVCSTL